jgi:hypothetical protein
MMIGKEKSAEKIADYRGVKKIKCGNRVYKFIYL